MCSISQDSFLSDSTDDTTDNSDEADTTAEAINENNYIFNKRRFYSSCRSGDLKSLSLDKERAIT